MELKKHRPKLLTPLVFVLFILEMFSFVDIKNAFSLATLMYLALTLIMLPIYWNLFKGKNWARIIMIAMTAVTTIIMLKEIGNILNSLSPLWMKGYFAIQILASIFFVIWGLLPKVSKYFRMNNDIISAQDTMTAGILRKFLAFAIDTLMSLIIYVVLHVLLAIIFGHTLIAESIGIILAISYIPLATGLDISIGQLICRIRIIDYKGNNVLFWKHLFRPFYSIIFCIFSAPMMIFDLHQRGVQDYIFKTLVIKR